MQADQQRLLGTLHLSYITTMAERDPAKARICIRNKERYWDKVKADELPAGLDYVVFDTAINSGPGRAVKLLQEVIGTTPDGAIGPLTLRAVAAMPAADVINKYQDNRLLYLQSLPTWPTFGRGWARRVEEGRALALQMSQST